MPYYGKNMPQPSASNSTGSLTPVQWLICIIAVIGFAFDTYELLMLPLILRPALEQLGGLTFGTPGYTQWRDLMFYVPAVCGGVFGLLGGYLTDRLGRRRVLTWSILIYAFSAFGAGLEGRWLAAGFVSGRLSPFLNVCLILEMSLRSMENWAGTPPTPGSLGNPQRSTGKWGLFRPSRLAWGPGPRNLPPLRALCNPTSSG